MVRIPMAGINLTLLTIIVIFFCPISIAVDADVNLLLNSLAQGRGRLASAQQQADLLTAQNQRDFELFQLYDTSRNGVQARIDEFLEQLRQVSAPRREHGNERIREWNAVCDKDLVGALPAAQYQACIAAREIIDQEIEDTELSIMLDEAPFVEKNITPLYNTLHQQEAELEKISLRMKERFALWDQANGKVEEIRADLENIRTAIRDACGGATGAAAAQCVGAGWDPVNRKLPPLNEMPQ